MGCYGIGVTRLVSAVIEQHHDDLELIMALVSSAVPRGHNPHRRCGSTSSRAGNTLSSAGLDVFVDDRDERPGVKFVDADLIGFPVRLVVKREKRRQSGD